MRIMGRRSYFRREVKIKNDFILQELLNDYLAVGKKIREYILEKGQKRFSTKKFVADIGEYYFRVNCEHLFNKLNQSEKATADYDYEATPKLEGLFSNYQVPIKIEVKTRHAQPDDPYLLGIKKEKFDLLVFVHLNEDFSCRYIGIMDKEQIKDKVEGDQKRLVFNKAIIKLWETGTFRKISVK